ncbi:FK506-binding protein 4 [Beauveria bassiana]|uniref:peptidylprolyl isomerase n=1 Tax=Beauveria bassiana TaxID=176275 RepID=A0A2N6NFJ7_BEABA|nr:FK506-binding protein 4 [Beauveria bassiana]
MAGISGPVYGLEVPPGEILIPASMDFPASFRITMAAVDPTEEPEADEEGNIPKIPRSTLRLVKRAFPGLDEDEDDEMDDEYLKALLAASDDDDEDDEEEENGGPSDPAKSKNDELDDVADPRVTELDSEDEDAPQLVDTTKKGKNKRTAEEAENLDELISKDDAKLSKKQQKKLKNNQGEAVAADDKKDAKKVQFAKNLEQGPSGSTKAAVGVKVVQGVTVDDRKIGSGRVVKNGDSVGVRYIGKLQNGKQFDANKKGKPFTFKVGKGQVIKGWDVGVVGMSIGGERRLTIPANLAYGRQALPGIPANSTLTFDVKLLEIK